MIETGNGQRARVCRGRGLLVLWMVTYSSLFGWSDSWAQEISRGNDRGTESQPAVFSGPQAGERLPPMTMQLVYDESAGKKIDPVTRASDRSLLLVFVHEVTRPSIALTRLVAGYARRQAAAIAESRRQGAETESRKAPSPLDIAICFLTDDRTETTALLKRARHALPDDVPLGISIDGEEGPGSYGLDRNMTLTVLLAHRGEVTHNFPLVQPSVAADAPKIGRAIVQQLGGSSRPTLADMQGELRPGMRRPNHAQFRALLRPVINKNATRQQVDEAAKEVERFAKSHPAFRQRLRQTAKRIIQAGKLDQYGSPAAQTYLKKWSGLADEEMKKGDTP